MRVGIHVDQLFFRAPGGIGTYIRELLPALAKADPSVELVAFHARFPGTPGEPWLRELRVEEIPAGIRVLYPGWNLLGRPPLPEPLRALDLVHATNPAAIPPAGPGQRLVVTVHDLAFLRFPGLFPRTWRALYRTGLWAAVRRARAILVPSRHTAEDLLERTRARPERIHVVPLAASLERGAREPERVLERLKVPRPYVLFVGTLEPRKNLVRLVRAYRRVAAEGVPHALVLAGPLGWHHHRLHRELALRGPGEVVLTGALPPADLDALYRGADLFVYPSLYEGFGLPVLEAMARGVPTVASAASSLPEVAGDAALLVDPRSVRELSRAIAEVLADRDLAERLAMRGRARAERFSWEETARGTLRAYEAALAGEGRGWR
ncbi:MAG TPA: glycosyltransferase family 1 protein [Actinomycetota bacterium]|nr:glycosyltransferase family 1 protein [Actinomycetota bacterium]